MILALHIGHDATALLFDSGKIIAIAEERVKRIKNYYGFAFFAIDKIVSRANVQFSKIEKVVIVYDRTAEQYLNQFKIDGVTVETIKD